MQYAYPFSEGTICFAARYMHFFVSSRPPSRVCLMLDALKFAYCEADHLPVPLSAKVIFYVLPHTHHNHRDTRRTHRDNFLNPDCYCHIHKMPDVAAPSCRNTDTVHVFAPVSVFSFSSATPPVKCLFCFAGIVNNLISVSQQYPFSFLYSALNHTGNDSFCHLKFIVNSGNYKSNFVTFRGKTCHITGMCNCIHTNIEPNKIRSFVNICNDSYIFALTYASLPENAAVPIFAALYALFSLLSDSVFLPVLLL